MSEAVSNVLRKDELGYLHWCPGCKRAHHIWVGINPGPNWTFNGNVDKPTFTPSVRYFHTKDGQEITTCHYFITDGQIIFCGDCRHELNGQTVPLPPWSDAGPNYGWN